MNNADNKTKNANEITVWEVMFTAVMGVVILGGAIYLGLKFGLGG